MGSYTQLSDSEVERIARAFGIGNVASWEAIARGCVNSNFAVSAAGTRYFLRINEGKDEADVRYESELVEALADVGVPTPAPLRARGGEPFVLDAGRFVSLFPWIEGVHREPEEVSVADAGAVGAALAGLHVAGASLSERFRRASRYRFEDVVARFESFRGSDDPELVPAIRAIEEEIAWQESGRAARESVACGVIHGDLFTDNVFFRDGALVALIDFEQASSGSLAYDLAVCVDAWCFREDFDPALVGALVAGYGAVRPLAGGEIDALYAETRAAALRFTVTRVTDAYLRPTGIPGKDFRRFHRRLLRLRETGAARFREWTGV